MCAISRPDPIPGHILARLLDAAHHAPSVGFMQPWTFLVISDRQTRSRVHDLYERERIAAAQFFDEPRRTQYLSFKLEGILDAPLNVCITCDPTCAGATVLGRNSIPETDLYFDLVVPSKICGSQRERKGRRGMGLGPSNSLNCVKSLGSTPHHSGRVPLSWLSNTVSGTTRDRKGWLAMTPTTWRGHSLRTWGRLTHSTLALVRSARIRNIPVKRRQKELTWRERQVVLQEADEQATRQIETYVSLTSCQHLRGMRNFHPSLKTGLIR